MTDGKTPNLRRKAEVQAVIERALDTKGAAR